MGVRSGQRYATWAIGVSYMDDTSEVRPFRSFAAAAQAYDAILETAAEDSAVGDVELFHLETGRVVKLEYFGPGREDVVGRALTTFFPRGAGVYAHDWNAAGDQFVYRRLSNVRV